MEREELSCSCSLRQCRICHEEDEGCASMESPCACSGSLKFVHRGCVQRWCDEKGSTLCEICLQNFEPGYTVPPKKAQAVDVAVTIRGSLEVPRVNYEHEDAPSIGTDAVVGDPDYAECARAAGRSASWCRSVALTFTVVLLLRHLIALVTVGAANQYAFSLSTIYLLRASGILLPFYAVMRHRFVLEMLDGEALTFSCSLPVIDAGAKKKCIKNAQVAGSGTATACDSNSLSKRMK